MVCCVQGVHLVVLLDEHPEGHFGEARLAGALAEELPAQGKKQKKQRYVRATDSMMTKASPLRRWDAAAGTSKATHQPAEVQEG